MSYLVYVTFFDVKSTIVHKQAIQKRQGNSRVGGEGKERR